MERIVYTVGPDDVITSVDDEWLVFARDNGAAALDRSAVVGSSLWDHVSGEGVRAIYASVMQRVRERGKGATIPFRCDSPDRRRFLVLQLEKGEADSLVFRSRLLREEERRPLSVWDSAILPPDVLPHICSFCLRVEVEKGGWKELETAIIDHDMLGPETPAAIEHVVCAECEAKAAS